MKIYVCIRHLLVLFIFIIISIVSYGQIDCYKRISDEAAKLDTVQTSTGTGFLIVAGLIITNRHVVEGANDLKVIFEEKGKKIYKTATIVEVSNEYDLAAILVKDATEDLFHKPVPYGFSESPMKLGDAIFVLGYPSPDIMGINIKLTDGLISSNTGFRDDNNMYQISAPIQPGNSGSPMFDVYGNIKGVVVASYVNGQLVNYAIKSKCLKEIFNEKFFVNKRGSNKFEPFQGPKPKSTVEFKNSINQISKSICLIVNTTKKTYYPQLKLQEGSFYSKSSSIFNRYNKECSDEKIEAIFKNRSYESRLNKTDEEYLNNWVETYFHDDFSRALFYTLHTNYNFNSPTIEFDLHYKFDYLQKIGAYENLIEDHELIFKINTDKIDETSFNYYIKGCYSYYYQAVVNLHFNDFSKLRNLISYIDFLLKLNEKVNNNQKEWLFKSAKGTLLIEKAYLMSVLTKNFSAAEVCSVINLAKNIYPEVEIWFEYPCSSKGNESLNYSNDFEKEGKQKYDQGKYLEAIELFTKSLQVNPTNANSYYSRGLSYFTLGKEYDQKALDDFNRALQINGNQFTYFYIGFIHQREGKLTQAILDYTACLKVFPNYAFAIFHRANCKGKLKDYEGAINDYNEIIKNENTLPEGFELATMYNNKAYYLIELKQFAKALPVINKALTLEPRDGNIWDTRGELYYKLKDYNKCIQDMTKAISLTELSPNSYYYRGLAHFKLNNKSKGCTDLLKAREYGNLESVEALNQYCR